MKTDWLIIGGGIHGVHVAVRLMGEADVSADQIRILDPEPRLLASWRRCTATTGMTHLRSPAVHNLDLRAQSLHQFAGTRVWRDAPFARPYSRPSLELFNAHCDHVIECYGLSDRHVIDRAVACDVDCSRVAVTTSSGSELEASRVVLAMGTSTQPRWPVWAHQDMDHVHHIFDSGFRWSMTDDADEVVVVGGGISAGQVALRLLEEGKRVTLVTRHELRKHQFDSEPGWLGPRYMTGFSREADPSTRRTLIDEARHKGSMSPDVYRAIRRATESGELRVLVTEVERVLSVAGTLLTQTADETIAADTVLLATGFESKRPGGELVDSLIRDANLPCAQCGYPVVDKVLRWHPSVFTTGPLAELELGPVARNISGARRAGDRLVLAASEG